jgi:DNA-directed RNA polymerase specialized sigma24 family protein
MIRTRPDESGERLEDAFGQLLESLRPDLVRFAYWLARDRSIAEDVVQEAMLRAWRARAELRMQRLRVIGCSRSFAVSTRVCMSERGS